MGKVYALKASIRTLFNFGKQPIYATNSLKSKIC